MVYELQTFNQPRFDTAMAWVAKEFDRTLSQYEAVKIHALGDALHVVRFYNPIIGGTFRKLQHGPVALDALNRVKGWTEDDQAPFSLTAKRGNTMVYLPKSRATRESMFTASEQTAVIEAAAKVFSMTFAESQEFFHGEAGENNFLGRAWKRTATAKAPISWRTILKQYADQTGGDLAALEALVCV